MKILTKGEYYGNKKLELNSGGIVLSEYDYLTEQTDWHYHENPYFMYVLQGNIYDINKKRKTNCTSGSLLFHNWNEMHLNQKKGELARGFHIEFERNWYASKKMDIDIWEGSKIIENPTMHHLLGQIYFEFKCQDPYTQLSIDLLLLQLCEISQAEQELKYEITPPWVSSLKEILHADDLNNLSLQSLSDILGVHPVHLSRTIPRYFSTTLGNYVRQQKVKNALKHLLNPKLSLTEIAYLCGFADQSHFSRTFKLYLGKTPKVFRAQLLC